MSDVEDGELLSSDEDMCTKKEICPKTKINHDKNNNIEKIVTNDSNKWDYEQNNIKIEKQSKISDSERKTNRISPLYTQRNKEGDRKRVCHSRSHNDEKKKRTSDNNKTDHKTPSNDSIDQNDCPTPKRRILCKYYAAGDCKNGVTCAFMHEEFPCKFYHDESSSCRAGSNCKYSHGVLTEEMKIVLEGFIHESKDKSMHNAPILKDEKIITKASQSRLNCLLPTPVLLNKPQHLSYELDFTEAYHEIANYPAPSHTYGNTLNFQNGRFREPQPAHQHALKYTSDMYEEPTHLYENQQNYPNNVYTEPNTQAYPIINKSKFSINFPKPGTEDFERSRQNVSGRNNPKFTQIGVPVNRNTFSRHSTNVDYVDENQNYFDNNHSYERSFSSNEKIISDDKNISSVVKKSLNNKIYAPARFLGTCQPAIKDEPELKSEPIFDSDFKDALKKLADQVVFDLQRKSPNAEKSISNEITEKMKNDIIKPEIDTSNILKNVLKIEPSNPTINDGDLMSESDKRYIEEMKSLINLDAQFENVIPWTAISLEPVKKQPYMLYNFKLSNIHDNPLADPRLIGHPVLSLFTKKELKSPTYSDDEEFSPLSIVKDEEVINNIPEDTKSYLINGKFKKKKMV